MPVNELTHFGVKGMRWGHVKQEPTGTGLHPSSSKATPKTKPEKVQKDVVAERKAKAKVFFDKADKASAIAKDIETRGFESDFLKQQYGKGASLNDRSFFLAYGTTKANAAKVAATNQKNIAAQHRKDGVAKENGKLTAGQKKAIVYIAGTTALLATYGVLHYNDIKTFNAKPGKTISENNFTRRYIKGSKKLFDKGFSLDDFKNLDDNDIKLNAGTVFDRITINPNENLGLRTYATFLQEDLNRYKALYPDTLRMRTGSKTVHVSSLVSGDEIVSPSTKKRVQFLIDLMADDVPTPTLMNMESTKKGRALVEDFLANQVAKPSSYYKNLSDEELGAKAYNLVSRGLVGNSNLTTAYFNKVKQAGYNAIMDDNDLGLLSEAPIILLDPEKHIKSKASTILTKQMEREAKAKLVELLSRKK
ncbi:MAG TPA: hypothetical protein PKW49_01150 [Paludibacteraceae bacterium]|nr:hypothetical protein [Paludibacteraceae bacterium]